MLQVCHQQCSKSFKCKQVKKESKIDGKKVNPIIKATILYTNPNKSKGATARLTKGGCICDGGDARAQVERFMDACYTPTAKVVGSNKRSTARQLP